MTEPSKEAMEIWRKAYDMGASCADGQFIDEAAALVIQEALAERDGRIAELTDRLGAMLSTTDVLMVRESVMPGFRDARINALAALKGRTDDHTG